MMKYLMFLGLILLTGCQHTDHIKAADYLTYENITGREYLRVDTQNNAWLRTKILPIAQYFNGEIPRSALPQDRLSKQIWNKVFADQTSIENLKDFMTDYLESKWFRYFGQKIEIGMAKATFCDPRAGTAFFYDHRTFKIRPAPFGVPVKSRVIYIEFTCEYESPDDADGIGNMISTCQWFKSPAAQEFCSVKSIRFEQD